MTRGTGLSRILVVTVQTLDLRAIDSTLLPSAAEPDWSPEGSRIAFVAKQFVDPSVCESTRSACPWGLFVAMADGTGAPERLGQSGWDYHDPDWSVDGRKIATGFGLDSDPSFSLIAVIAVSGRTGSYQSGSGSLSEPSWSPYGHGIVVRFGTGADSGIVLYDEVLGQTTQLLVFPGSPRGERCRGSLRYSFPRTRPLLPRSSCRWSRMIRGGCRIRASRSWPKIQLAWTNYCARSTGNLSRWLGFARSIEARGFPMVLQRPRGPA